MLTVIYIHRRRFKQEPATMYSNHLLVYLMNTTKLMSKSKYKNSMDILKTYKYLSVQYSILNTSSDSSGIRTHNLDHPPTDPLKIHNLSIRSSDSPSPMHSMAYPLDPVH